MITTHSTPRTALIALILLTLVLPMSAFAQPSRPPAELTLSGRTLPGGPLSVLRLIEIVGNWIFTLLLVLAVIFLLLAAYNYMGGNEENVQKAHRMLMYTAVAVAVALLAFGIVNAVQFFVYDAV